MWCGVLVLYGMGLVLQQPWYGQARCFFLNKAGRDKEASAVHPRTHTIMHSMAVLHQQLVVLETS